MSIQENCNYFAGMLELLFFMAASLVALIHPLVLLLSTGSDRLLYLDDSEKLEAQDREAESYLLKEERRQEAQRRKEEYEDYMEWVRMGRP